MIIKIIITVDSIIAIFSCDHDAGGEGYQGAGGGGQVGARVHPRGEGEGGRAGKKRGCYLKMF